MIPNTHIGTLLKSLPNKAGVYQFFDAQGKIIYIGKAKNLKKRVASYFNKDRSANGKIKFLVRKIADIQFVVVNSEFDAFLLENNLIKKYQPKYNIQLKDDKSFPWICIKKEPFPRVFPTRNPTKDGSVFFGPYASARMMHTVLDLVKQLYPLRTCNLKLTPANIQKKKFKVCLEYHLGNCKAPCIGLQSEEEYKKTLEEIKEIIKGNISTVTQQLRKLMQVYADKMEFEKAQTVKEKLDLLERYQSKSTIVNPKIDDVDVFSILKDNHTAYVNYLKVVKGAIVQAHTIEMKSKLDESREELLALAITDFRQRFASNSTEIILPFPIDYHFVNAKSTIPQRGDKKHLLELSERNAKYYKLEREKQKDLVDPERHTKRILSQLKTDLRLQETPRHIECFDNSNLQGAHPTAAMVVFKDAKPAKKEYRHFNIKTVEGPDDFASMEEIVFRRYKRLLDEKKPLPQLIVVDGGKGQLRSALKSLEKLELRGRISIIGIAKKLEEIYFPNDQVPLYIDKKSESLKLIQQLRDEAHRFGITHHRKRREKNTIKSLLTDIPGIGEASAKLLLQHFKSVKQIENTPLKKLESIIGKARAATVSAYFEKNKKTAS